MNVLIVSNVILLITVLFLSVHIKDEEIVPGILPSIQEEEETPKDDDEIPRDASPVEAILGFIILLCLFLSSLPFLACFMLLWPLWLPPLLGITLFFLLLQEVK